MDEGSTRVPFFLRWPEKVAAGSKCASLVRHYDILPTFAQIIGAVPKEKDQLAGRSFLPLLENPKAEWKNRYAIIHKGRWGYQQKPTQYQSYAIRTERWRLVNGKTLHDIQKDPLQKKNVFKEHPEVVKELHAYYDDWWQKALPKMVNEDAPLEGHNTFHLMFWKQYNMPVPPVGKRPYSKETMKKPAKKSKKKAAKKPAVKPAVK